jgi:hypothetical protein
MDIASRASSSATVIGRVTVDEPERHAESHFDEFLAYAEASRERPIYIVLGVQGSGTNLIAKTMVELFNFSVMRDRSMVFNAAARLGRSPTAPAIEREIRELEHVVSPSLLRRKTSKHIIKKTQRLEGLSAVLRRSRIQSGADFARLIYTYRAFTRGAAHIGIKSDDLWQNLHLLDQVIPNHRIVMITRDFRDNLLSVSGKYFGPIEPLCAAQYVSKQLAHYGPAFRRSGSRGYHVTFEALLNSTRECMDGLARHFELTPAVDLDVAIPALKFRPNKIGKWKRLPAQQLAWCEGILRDDLIGFGYPLISESPEAPPWSQLAAAQVRDSVKRAPQKIRSFVRRFRR